MSDQDTTIFTDDKSAVAPATLPVVDPNDPVALLVGETRKYKTMQDLAKAYVHIDDFAEKLKDENSKLRQELATAKTLDDVLERLKAPEPSKTDQPSPSIKTLGAEDIAAIVKQTVTGMETARTREANLRATDAKMKAIFGDKAAEVFAQEAATPEMKTALIALAGANPDKFVALFTKEASGDQSTGKTQINTASTQHLNVSGRVSDPTTKEFYDAIRKKEPTKYYSQPVQLAMQKAAISNRTHFFGK